MTGTEVNVEAQAQRIAARGREALLERLRVAYADAAAAHADLLSLDEARLEAIVQAAAERADGLQWRRALARVASDELGLSVAQALEHPAVIRAQELVGAPSYEQSLAELIARPVPPPVTPTATAAAPASASEAAAPASEAAPAPEDVAPDPVAPDAVAPTEGAADELETVQADDVVIELLPEPDPAEYSTEAYDVEAEFTAADVPPAPVNPFSARAAEGEPTPESEGEPTPESEGEPATAAPEAPPAAPEAAPATEATFAVIHLGGVANLPTKREGLSVRLSADGLDIMQGDDEIIGRLIWGEIETLEVPSLRARRRHRQGRARLVVRTPHGDASFEVPDVSADELRARVEPLMGLYGRA